MLTEQFETNCLGKWSCDVDIDYKTMTKSCIDEIYGPPLDIWIEVGDNPSILGLSLHKTTVRPGMASWYISLQEQNRITVRQFLTVQN